MTLTPYQCPHCGAELTDHYDPEDIYGLIEEDGERLRCEGKLTGEYYAPFTDEQGVEHHIPYRTRSCGWFRLAEVSGAD